MTIGKSTGTTLLNLMGQIDRNRFSRFSNPYNTSFMKIDFLFLWS